MRLSPEILGTIPGKLQKHKASSPPKFPKIFQGFCFHADRCIEIGQVPPTPRALPPEHEKTEGS